ncbi:LANO_0E06414g1_1 [Lachancea nothofagi CBS 11611]|uniref:non-specific serine/threonine protein kinase n=1 Tax=Lachancea nothofagi CBS 11611 TaxID=1266666 RepID=A0A1G4JTS9_9SACH|nr:LANO_0E06414g1_1 [Lachancea nothofagi CBS 11611]
MGAQLSLIAHTAPSIAISSYIDVLDEIHYLSQLNSSRFLKTCKALDPNGEVLIKVFIKPSDDYNLAELQSTLRKEAQVLAQLPNALNYSKIVESDRAGYLIRQHLKSSAYDRLSSRPFFETIEAKFIVFQLLRALDDIHTRGVCHGDLKLENLLLTSWNWLVVTDFSSHIKPTYLPADNPGEYSFYFDTSQRRSCYIAPERFDSTKYQDKNKTDANLTCEMDIFSAGCCIAEIFAEGNCIFNLSQLFRYQNGEYDPKEFLDSHLDDPLLKELIMSMILRDPLKRISIKSILRKYRGSIFPEHFYDFYYDFFRQVAAIDGGIPLAGKICSTLQLSNLSFDMDKIVQNIYNDLPRIYSILNYPLEKSSRRDGKKGGGQHMELTLNALGTIRLRNYGAGSSSVADESSLLTLSLLLHTLRVIKSTPVKLKCMELVATLSQYISDSNKLDRVIPFIASMFFDECSSVQAHSIHILSQILALTTSVNRINEALFTDFLIPRLKKLTQIAKHNEYVRMALAEELGEIARSASRFQDASFTLSMGDDYSTELSESVRKQKRKLIHGFEEITVVLLTDSQASVKVALLSDILPLCSLFGREKTNDVILSHLITYLNDKNASLRIQLIKAITGIAVLLGPITLEQYILPLLVQTVTDSEELVVVMVLKSLRTLSNVGLVQKRFFFDIAKIVSALLLHPNIWIRQFALAQLVEISNKLSRAEVYCLLYPVIKPYFEFDVQLTWESMISSCKKPISRTVYNLLCTWSLRSSNSLFWKQVPSKHKDSFGNNSTVFINKNYTAKNYGLAGDYKLSKVPIKLEDNREILVTNEDKGWLEKIKTVGLKETEIWKIAALRGYVFRVAKMIARKPDAIIPSNPLLENGITSRKGLSSYRLPRNVFFDVLFVNNGAQLNESTHVIVKRSGISGQPLTTAFHSLSQSKSIDLTKSIQLNTKAAPSLTSNLDNVYVQLEGSRLKPQMIKSSPANESDINPSMYIIKNSYEGHDPYIELYLRSIDVKPTFKSFPEFGHISSVRTEAIGKGFIKSFSRFKFLLQVTEHRSTSINVVAASPHDPYVLSGSEEGAIKLWNITKILAGVTFGSSFTLETSSAIMDIKPFPGFDLFTVACKDGTVLLVKVNFRESKGFKTFTALQVVRKLKLERSSEHVIQLSVIPGDVNPVIFALTNTSTVVLIDPRFMSVIRRIENDPLHGAVLCFAIGHDKTSIILGSSRGIVDIWDSRFGTLVHSWTFSDGSPITEMALYPSLVKREEKTVLIVGGSNACIFTVWDYAKKQCRQLALKGESAPPIAEFIPKSVTSESLTVFSEPVSTSVVTSLTLEGHNVLVSETETNSILCFNPRDKTMTPVVSDQAAGMLNFKPVQLTANTTALIKQRAPTEKQSRNNLLNFHNDSISSITIAKSRADRLLVSADRSGVINFYK